MIDHAHSVFGEPASEPGEGGMIGSGIIERKPQKFLEGDPIVDLSLQLGVGIDLKALLEQEAFHKYQGDGYSIAKIGVQHKHQTY